MNGIFALFCYLMPCVASRSMSSSSSMVFVMAVTDEQAVKLFNEFVEVCIMVIKDAHVFIGTHDLKRHVRF